MSSLWTGISRQLQRLKYGRGYVGQDLQGNRFFEWPNPQTHIERTVRRVKYRRQNDMWTYATGISRLPAQWTAWLAHTRPNAPSIEELLKDQARQQRVAVLAAQIAARDEEERVNRIEASKTFIPTLDAPTSAPLTSTTQHEQAAGPNSRAGPVPPPTASSPLATQPPVQPSPFREADPVADAPKPWAPTSARRRG